MKAPAGVQSQKKQKKKKKTKRHLEIALPHKERNSVSNAINLASPQVSPHLAVLLH